MNLQNNWSSLFLNSSFFCLKKDDELNPYLKDLYARLHYQNIENYHPRRKNEFLLGRVCASKAYEMRFGSELIFLPIGENRSPLWPNEVVGSISHNQFWVGAAVSNTPSLLGVGIDFEVMGRTKSELSRHIRTKEDLREHTFFSETELLTIIFSAKESLYKALYPTVKNFFGFDAAAVRKIDEELGTFAIDLVSKISPDFGPSERFQFEGRFEVIEKTCLTVLEISK